MKLTYRILKIDYPTLTDTSYFIAQYKILGIWMNIGITTNTLFKHRNARCETIDEAYRRINLMVKNLNRTSNWPVKITTEVFKRKI